MSIITILQNVLTTLNANPEQLPKFYYGSKAQQNIKADKEELTNGAIYMEWPVYSQNTLLVSGAIQETYPLALFFFKKSKHTATPQQDQLVIDEMRALANLFVKKCAQSKLFSGGLTYKIIDDVKVNDLSATGCVLDISLTPNNITVC